MMRNALILVAVATALLGTAANAQAAPIITTDFCNGTPNSAENWSSGNAIFGGFTFENHCSTGGGLQIFSDAPQVDEQASWFFDAPPESPIISYSFDLDGADTSGGITYLAYTCDSCAEPDAEITSASPGDPTIHVNVPEPQGNQRISIDAKCNLVVPCVPSATPVRISNIKVKLTDETAPTISGYLGDGSFDPGNFVGWTNKPVLPAQISGQDQGFGVRRLSMNAEGVSLPIFSRDFAGDCLFSLPITYLPICPSYPDAAAGLADLSSLGDGIHNVTISGEDALGNSTTTDAAQIGIDRTKPAPPASSSVDFTSSGWPGQRWTSDPNVEMHWPVEPEVADPDIDSPFENQDFSLHRDGSPTVTHSTLERGSDGTQVTLPSDGSWELAIRYVDEAGNSSEPSTKSVGLDADAPFAPQGLGAVDWLSEGALAEEQRISWSPPEENPDLESGVCGYVVAIDEFLESNPLFRVNDATIETSWPLPADIPEGTNYFHVRAVSCAGIASATVTAEIRIDTEGPELGVSGLAAPGEWTSSAQTALIAAGDDQSGVAKVGYKIDNGAITWVTDDHASAPMPEGEHDLTAYAEDVAGNLSTFKTAVRTDTHAPIAELEPASVDDPTRVAATVTDAYSGLVAASVELRRVDAAADSQERQWSPLGGAEPITRGTTSTVELGRILDDARLAPGDYELRVNAIDLAGNSTTASAFATRSVQLPLRRRAEISAAVAQVKSVCRTKSGKACSSGRRCVRKSRCRMVQITDRDNAKASVVQTFSQKSILIGDALDPNGAPIVGAPVSISSTPFLHDSEPIGSAVTDANGHYELAIPAGPSRSVTARIGGGPTQQPASASATINVRSEIEFYPRPTKLVSGSTMALRGRVLHPEWLPVGGVSVSFQWYSPDGWVTFSNPTQTDAQGRFSPPYTWQKRPRSSTVRIRARIDRPAGWPFAPGSSDTVKISVRAAR